MSFEINITILSSCLILLLPEHMQSIQSLHFMFCCVVMCVADIYTVAESVSLLCAVCVCVCVCV